jgi:hypothetical protein
MDYQDNANKENNFEEEENNFEEEENNFEEEENNFEEEENNFEEEENNFDYNQFKNEVLNLIYGNLPSYAYFDESNLEADLNDGYWHDFTDEESKKILIYFSKKYMDVNLNDNKIKQEKWDAKDLLIDLLLDYF